MKKLINDPHDVVTESIEGVGLAHPELVTVNPDPLFVTRSSHNAKEQGRRSWRRVHVTNARPDPRSGKERR